MDPIIERFNRLVKSMFVDTSDIDFNYNNFSGNDNNDYAEAWEELNDFLSSPEYDQTTPSVPKTPEILRQDFNNIGVPFDSDFSVTKEAYKNLLKRHHPDKNNTTTQSMKSATEKTKNLNISFQKIKAWELAKKG